MDYQGLIQTNPIVQFAQGNGFQMSSWVNMNVMMSASVKSFEIYVYANTAQDSMFLATQLKQYIEMQPMSNSAGVADDISIGLRQPTLDTLSQAYKTTMMMTAGMLTMGTDSAKIIHNGEFACDFGCDFLTDWGTDYSHLGERIWSFTSGFSNGFKTRTQAKLYTTRIPTCH